jgi:AcrR family transcriptional regulator
MPVTRTPREGWIERGLKALASGGPDDVRIERIAESLGVSKGGFYWHFDGRRALLDEMLDKWEEISVGEVIELIEGGGGDAESKLGHLFRLAGARGDVLETDLAVRDWARRDRRVAARLRRADNRRMDYLRALFGEIHDDADEVEVACLLTFSLWIGNHFIAADHRGRSRAEVVKLALRRLEAD